MRPHGGRPGQDASGLDHFFEDVFRDYTSDKLAVIKVKHATEAIVLGSPAAHRTEGADMLRHHGVVLPRF
jgi:hypothetical protein